MSHGSGWRLAGGVALVMLAMDNAWGEALTEFDPSVLKARGIDPKVAEHFGRAPRFSAGRNRVALQVNGAPSGHVVATFDADGQLCLDSNLLDQAGIAAPSGLPSSADSAQCLRSIDGLTGVQVQLGPGKQQVQLLVPTDLLLASAPRPRTWASGGMAGLLNYDALMLTSSASGQSSQFRSLGTELGFNASDWVVRSRQNYTSFQGVERFETLYTQASRTWERFQANVQLGQLNMRSSLFAGEAFTGLQILPETALASQNGDGLGAGTAVQGLAYSPARVEVRQSGVVIYTTLVPSGPFTLRDLPLLSHRLDLEVSVFEESGEQRDFRVPAANVRPVSVGMLPGYGIAAGKVRRFHGDERDAPSFFAVSKDWQWGSATQLSGGLMGAGQYQSLGWGVQQALTRRSVVSFQQLSSRTPQSGQGRELQATFSAALGPGLSASLTASQRSQGFQHLADTGLASVADDFDSRSERQWGASLSHSNPLWGAFSGSLTRYAVGGGQDRSRVSTSWSRAFSGANLSLSVQRDSGDDARGTGLYASLSLPLGRNRSLNTYGRHDERNGLRTGARYTEQISDTLGYSLGADRSDSGQTDVNGRLNALPRYTSVDLGYSRSGVGASSYDLTLRGGLAIHEEGLTPSPYPLRDTFGLLKVGDAAGVKVSTPQGPVWTDGGGRAVAASLPAYQTSRIEIDTVSLPRHLDVLNGYQEVEAGRGAVPRLDFSVSSVRRLMLHVRTAEGDWVPKGASVHGNQGEYLTSVVDAGLVYLADAPDEVRLQVMLPDNRPCHLELDTAGLPESSLPYATVEVVCRAG
ncbi:fimbria/pilus outer membrane usher protein [Pseudomonas sp. AL03]|uniref:fimbria/pilus outer membrane usher protein n=1 Tax=Pseudomonas sp. AL03 TaxID=3042230 RepID=UPI00249C5191|nr:fimbria/pilus outer membrane usher protein [Pseudomonas sp. AL03]MDI3271908.1 fimbria/pilus outer membrane usher protein [Pseudomonas sp. AL03]